jgi:hypothetical protein
VVEHPTSHYTRPIKNVAAGDQHVQQKLSYSKNQADISYLTIPNIGVNTQWLLLAGINS